MCWQGEPSARSNTSNALRTETYNGLPIVFREDGYINMTKAAKAFGKDRRLQNFWASPDTIAYVDELEKCTGIHSIETKKGRYGGTFCHPKLAVFFARWLDVRFAVWCDLMIGCASSSCVATTSSGATSRLRWWWKPGGPLSAALFVRVAPVSG